MVGKNVHVVHHKNGNNWQVKYENEEMPLAMFDTQREAIANGREVAMQQKAELLVHRKDGVIRNKWSYGHDPRSVKG
ncbi:DUF2188 domain-containing protein [Eubacteriales bacterium OttesenSCG-928-A19]|nr:DUF2188 domain-containing protein [Eubacteriales bacterium OttesenSCG-928-A19]